MRYNASPIQWLLPILITLLFNLSAKGQFTNIAAPLANVSNGTLKWGDFENDGDLDLLVTGDRLDSPYSGYTYIAENTNGAFAVTEVGLMNVEYSSAAWGDYDNDGNLDVVVCGWLSISDYFTAIYKNNNGNFIDINANLEQIYRASSDWGDYDNDGDLDLLLTGNSENLWGITYIYTNDKGVFNKSADSLMGVSSGDAKWGDYDKDGDLDILIIGDPSGSSQKGETYLYRNDNGSFVKVTHSILGGGYGSLDWGDYDGDGDLDILLTGYNETLHAISRIYRNDAGTFNDIGGLISTLPGKVAYWGDFDNDGDLDVLLSTANKTQIIRNDTNTFSTVLFDFGVVISKAAIGDFDKDNDLDIATIGYETRIWRNDYAVVNKAPLPPSTLKVSIKANDVTFQWSKGTDDKTSKNGCTYNLYVSTLPGATTINTPMANVGNGYRRVAQIGNTNSDTSWTLKNLKAQTYYWSVQTIDNSYIGSPFATEGSFEIKVPSPITLLYPEQNSVNQDTNLVLRWKSESSSTNYWLQVAKDELFASLIINDSLRTDTVKALVSLPLNSTYFWRVKSKNNFGWSAWSTVFQFRTYYPFVNLQASLLDTYAGDVEWGDYNNDGDLDLLVVGRTNNYTLTSTIYENNSGSFSAKPAGAPGMWYASVAWGDYDNDGDLDYAIIGAINQKSSEEVSIAGDIYTNDNGTFIRKFLNPIPRAYRGSLDWGDYDNDGDIDLLLTGDRGTGGNINPLTVVIRNNITSFETVYIGLPGVFGGDAKWVDFNNDGWLDIIISGHASTNQGLTSLYKNTKGVFTKVNVPFDGVYNSSIDWGDYDNDGDLDLLLTGAVNSSKNATKIYQNTNTTFTDIGANLLPISQGKGSWGDFDNDGDLDILVSGSTSYNAISGAYSYGTKFYVNKNGIFTDTVCGVYGLGDGNTSWGDYDNDGDLDIAINGTNNKNGNVGIVASFTQIYKNIKGKNIFISNTIPVAPQNFSTKNTDYDIDLGWSAASDIQSPTKTLTYNISIGNNPIDAGIFSPMANRSSGYRKIVQRGNAQHSLHWKLNKLRPGKYYWQVQAIDQAYAGSAFSAKQTFLVVDPIAPTLIYPHEEQDSIKAKADLIWLNYNGALSYHLQIAFDSLFTELFKNDSTLTDTVKTISDFILNRNYYWRVKAKTTIGNTQWSYYRHFFTQDNPTIITADLVNVFAGNTAWADFDNDGDLDLALNGVSHSPISGTVCTIYRNNANGTFTDISANIPGTSSGSLNWADFDNDNDLDLLITGDVDGVKPMAKIFRNDQGIFVDHNAALLAVTKSAADCGDYDNDGDIDIIITGTTFGNSSNGTVKLYNNAKGVFSETATNIQPVCEGAVKWGDYDNDGDLDIALFGISGVGVYSLIYRNDVTAGFTDIKADLNPMFRGSVRWADYDNDGDLDLLHMGLPYNGPYKSSLYRNDLFKFTNTNADLPYLSNCEGAWGDYENDGDLDILFSGSNIFLNNKDGFHYLSANLPGLQLGAVSWADYDNDHDLDMLMCGLIAAEAKTYFYRSNARANTPPTVPTVPTALTTTIIGNKTIFSWNKSSDNETPTPGLTYNLRVGTTPGGNEIVSLMADEVTGHSRIVEKGNVNLNTRWAINGLKSGVTYYWSVQAVDNTYECSALSTEKTFIFYPVNNLPVATNDFALTAKNVPVKVDVLANDYDPNNDVITTVAIINGPFNGQAAIINFDSILYTPKLNYTGRDSLQYVISDNNGKDTATLVIKVDYTASTLGVNELNYLHIFPNPFSTQTTVALAKEIKYGSIKIYDVLGKEIREVIFSEKEIIISRENLPGGIYFIRLFQNNNVICTKKLIITE